MKAIFGALGRLKLGRGKIRSFIDRDYYYRCYPDVEAEGFDAAGHYVSHGWREGRNPSKRFHTLYYICRHMGAQMSEQNPLEHYLAVGGEKSGLATSPETPDEWTSLQMQRVAPHFDVQYYKDRYWEQLGGLDPIDHYFAEGWRIGCNPCAGFDTRPYLERNRFLETSDVNPFYHALLSGVPMEEARASTPDVASPAPTAPLAVRAERADLLRLIAPYFDAEFYLAQNRDVADAGLNPMLHYVDYGWREGRSPSLGFDGVFYRSRYGAEMAPDTNPLVHYATIGAQRGYVTSPVGTKPWPRPKAPADSAWDEVAPAADRENVEICIIVPVYRGYDDTLATIHSVLANPQKLRFNLVVIDDCGPEPALAEKLRELAARNLFIYYENERNLGFIGSVNRGLTFFPELDVVLLNSDTLVFGDWLDRLVAHAHRDPSVATITPFSNTATLCSYPDDNKSNKLALECSLAQLDEYAKTCNAGRSIAIPTGVGFCFYIRRSVIDQIGMLDPAFGRGYGEENDFCMRVIKAGHKNILAQDVFVYHSGRVSFAEFHADEYGSGQKLLIGKHPDYARRVAGYFRSQAGRDGRARLDLYRQARHLGARTAVLVTMDGGGGVITHVNDLARRLEASGLSVMLVTIRGDLMRFRPFDPGKECYTPSLKPIDLNFESAVFAEFLDWLEPEIIHVQSMALASWRAARAAMQILARHGSRLHVTLHDFDPICFRFNLVNREGRHCAERTLEGCRACVRDSGEAVNRVDPPQRFDDWRALLTAARKVFVPSHDTARRFAAIFPDLTFTVRGHEEPALQVARLARPPSNEILDLVTIGGIGSHKGGDVIYSMALDARERGLPLRFHIVGYSSMPNEMKAIGIEETGQYKTIAECAEAVRKIGPSYVLLPAIWPETYSYTLSIALALGVPPVVFDLGAPADRVREAGFGLVLDADLVDAPQAINDLLLRRNVEEDWGKVRPVAFETYPAFPADYYGLD